MKYKIYTDGACSGNPGPGGWAAVVYDGNQTTVLRGHEPNTTNNRMELIGMITALAKALELCEAECTNTFELYSDSAYVVNAINCHWVESWRYNGWKTTRGDPVKNIDLWKQCSGLLAALRKAQVEFTIHKVKGHAGDPLNEYADKIAKGEIDNGYR